MAWWTESLLRATWQGGLAVMVFYALLRIVKLQPATQVWIWRLVIAKMILAIFLPIVIAVPATAAAGDGRSTSSTPALVSFLSIFAFLLVCGVVLKDYRVLRMIRRCSEPVAVPSFEDLRKRMGVKADVEVRSSRLIASPMLIGALRPAIVVPQGFRPDAPESEAILAHELAHANRKDLLWGWLCVAGEALLFFHPLFHLAKHELRLAQELSCDKEALETTKGKKSEYGRVLLTFASSRSSEPLASTAGALALGPASSLRKRLEALEHEAGRYRSGLPLLALAFLTLPAFQYSEAQPNSKISAQPPAVFAPAAVRHLNVVSPQAAPESARHGRTNTPAGG